MASALALAALPSGSEAAGLGKVTVFSALGQPLRAEMEVFATREELAAMKVQLAPQDAFRQAGVEYTPTLSGITMTVDKRPNGQPIIRLTSTKPINDPFVDVLLELNWATGRLIREYTFLLDPPEYAAKAAAAAPAPAIVRPAAAARQPVEARSPEDRPARAAAYRPRASEQVQKPADGGGTYEVKRGETLSRIASDLRPEGVSLDQMLLGLFRANQDAFDQGNINRLKAGKILSIPDKAALEAIPKAEAKTVIVAQSSDWGGYRRKLAAAAGEAPGREEGARQQAAGKVSTRVEERAGPSAEPKDQLRVSKTDLPGVKPLPPSKRTDEDLIAKEKALRDANERLASLERNVAELQRLVELKSQSLADLEKQSAGKTVPVEAKKSMDEARAAPPPVAAAPATMSAATGAPAGSAKTPDKPFDQAAEVKPAEVVAKAEPRQEEVKAEVKPEVPPPPVAETPKPPEVPKPKPVVVPPPPEEPGFVEGLLGSPGALLGGGGIIALLAAYWFVKRRRESDGETPFDTSSTLAPLGDSVVPKSVFRSTGGQSVDTAHSIGQTDFSQAGPGSIDTDEVDPVAEADVYMAYGRDAQAEEILLEAKQKDPKRHAIHLKLLEIYLARKDAKPFEVLAAELYKATDGAGPDWDKALAMGRQLDPRNPLFGAAKAGDQGSQEAGPTRSVRPEPAGSAMAMAAGTESIESTFTRPGQLSQVAAAAGVAAAGVAAGLAGKELLDARPEQAAQFADLDFDLGVSDAMPAAPREVTETMLATTLSLPPRVEAAALDFDLASSMPSSPPPESGSDVAQLVEDASAFDVTQLVEDASAFDVTQLVGPASQKGSAEADAGLDFDFDLAEALPEEAGWEAKTLTQGEPVEMLDIGSAGDDVLEFDVRLTESTVLGEAMQHTAFDMSSISLDLAQPDLPSPEAAPVAGAPLDFSFESDQEDTLVNPSFAVEQTETQLSTQFGSVTDLASAEPEISSSEEVATKIELARAYQEMGDLEGARELLQEVVNEGDAAQRDAAMALLAGLRE